MWEINSQKHLELLLKNEYAIIEYLFTQLHIDVWNNYVSMQNFALEINVSEDL